MNLRHPYGTPIKYTNANMKICQYLRLHIKIIYQRFRIIVPFAVYAPKIYKMFVYKHTETIEYAKK